MIFDLTFSTRRTADKEELLKRGTVNAYKSHIKMWILDETRGKVDIDNEGVFRDLAKFFGGFNKQLKAAGKGDTKHTPPLPPETTQALHTLLGNLLQVLQSIGTDAYLENLAKLPESCRNNYHEVLMKSIVYVVIMFDVRRGQEGLVELPKDLYQKEVGINQMEIFVKTVGEASKNHKMDNEDLDNAGVILCHEDEFGFNPGKLLEYYLSKLNPKNKWLFQKPHIVCKRFSLHEPANEDRMWYENSRIGKNQIGKMLPSLCKLAGVKTAHNHSIRATGIRALRKSGYDKYQICKMTGHRDPNTLANYDSLDLLDRTKMALGLQHGHKTMGGKRVDIDSLMVTTETGTHDDSGFIDITQSNSEAAKADPLEDSGFTETNSEPASIETNSQSVNSTLKRQHTDENDEMESNIKRALIVVEKNPKKLCLTQDHVEEIIPDSGSQSPSKLHEVVVDNPGLPMLRLTQVHSQEIIPPSVSEGQSSSRADKVSGFSVPEFSL